MKCFCFVAHGKSVAAVFKPFYLGYWLKAVKMLCLSELLCTSADSIR